MRYQRLAQCWLIGLIVTLLAGCSGNTTSTPSHVSVLLANAKHASLRDANFTITWTSGPNSASGTGELTLTPVQRDDLELKLQLGNQKAALDVVADGATTYAKQANETMWDEEPTYATDINPVTETTHIIDYDRLHDAQLVDSAPIAGIPAWHIKGTLAINSPEIGGQILKLVGSEEIWLRQSDAFPLQITEHVAASGTNNGEDYTINSTVSYTFVAWNTHLTITPPSPDLLNANG